jgi:hypothetical protein
MMVIDWPMASSGVKPKMRCAAAFQLVITPLRSLEMMASSEDFDNSGEPDAGVVVPPMHGSPPSRKTALTKVLIAYVKREDYPQRRFEIKDVFLRAYERQG